VHPTAPPTLHTRRHRAGLQEAILPSLHSCVSHASLPLSPSPSLPPLHSQGSTPGNTVSPWLPASLVELARCLVRLAGDAQARAARVVQGSAAAAPLVSSRRPGRALAGSVPLA
jgi:hypothetical protein